MARSLAKVIATLFIEVVRGGAITSLLIAVVVPSALATVFLLSVDILYSQGGAVIALYTGRPTLLYSEKPLDNTTCIEVVVTNALVKTVSGVFEVQMYVASGFEKYVELNKLEVVSFSRNISRVVFSVGWLLASRYGLEPGSRISICIGKSCFPGYVTHVHRGNSYFNSIAIASGLELDSGRSMYLCRAEGNWILMDVVKDFSSSVMYAMNFLTLFTLLAYLPIQYLALNKSLAMLKEDIEILHGIGVSLSILRLGFATICCFLYLLLALYGISMGTLLVHFSTWILRFFGIVIVKKPVLSLEVLSMLTSVFLAIVVAEALLVSRRIGGSTWVGF